jgi:hypothetical protein
MNLLAAEFVTDVIRENAAIRELLDRGYGRPRQAVEVSAPAGDPLQELFEEIDALNRKRSISRFRTNPLKPDLRPHQRRVGYFFCAGN